MNRFYLCRMSTKPDPQFGSVRIAAVGKDADSRGQSPWSAVELSDDWALVACDCDDAEHGRFRALPDVHELGDPRESSIAGHAAREAARSAFGGLRVDAIEAAGGTWLDLLNLVGRDLHGAAFDAGNVCI